MQRRSFITASLAAALATTGCVSIRQRNYGTAVLFGCGNSSAGYCAQAVDQDGALVWQQLLPGRGHSGCCIGKRVAFVARRPGTWMQVRDGQTGKLVQQLEAPSNRYFMGHASFCPSSQRLYVSEADRQTSEGVLGIYQFKNGLLSRLTEWRGFGIGLHEIKVMANSTLALAVGGVHTQGRNMLNIDAMQPALMRVDSATGVVMDQQRLSNPKLSIRHLDVWRDTIVVAQQLRGEVSQVEPLVAVQRQAGEPLQNLAGETQMWRGFQHYVASVAMNDRHIIATSPRGNCFACWQKSSGALVQQGRLLDASGTTWLDGMPWLASGAGVMLTGHKLDRHLASPVWDNHWFS